MGGCDRLLGLKQELVLRKTRLGGEEELIMIMGIAGGKWGTGRSWELECSYRDTGRWEAQRF